MTESSFPTLRRATLFARLALCCIAFAACNGAESAPESPMPSAGASSAGVGAHGGTGGAAGAGVNAGASAGGSSSATSGAGGRAGTPGTSGVGAGAGGGSAGAGAGANGGAAGAAGASGTPAESCSAGAFCDSFESGGSGLDAARWSVVAPNCNGDGRAEIDAATAHSGTRSLRVSSSGGYCNHVFASAVATLPSSGALYGRFFVRFERALTASHVTFVALRDAREGKDLRMGGQSEILMWNRESDDATLPELSPTGVAMSVKPEINRWICIEFMIDGAQRKLSTWVDGTAVPALQVEGEPTPDVDRQWLTKADWMPMPADAKFGWESYGADANTLWFDDVALGAARLGCEPR